MVNNDLAVIASITKKLQKPIREVKYDEQGRVILLHMGSLDLTEIPGEIKYFTSLETLTLSANRLHQFPHALERLPVELTQLPKLFILDVSDNRTLIDPPLSIAEEGPAAVKKYFHEKMRDV